MESHQKKIIYVVYKLVIITTVILLFSCNSPTEVNELTYGTFIPGVSVSGIKLGDTKTTVESILGKPTSMGWADGSNRGWRFYLYTDSTEIDYYKRRQITVYFLEFGANFDTFDTVDVITVGLSYKGKTEFAIGIGSSVESVHQVYGIPDTSMTNQFANSIQDVYCVNKKWFSILYEDNLITSMSIGNYKPYPAIHYCK